MTSRFRIMQDDGVAGDVGELAFALWARQAGIVTNRVGTDRHGWDYLLEFSRAHLTHGGISLDLVPCELRAFVQVKTTASPSGRVRIKLSNWQRMAKDLAPWFVAIVVLDDRKEPTEAYLVHIDRGWCSRVLKRLRQLPEQEQGRLDHHELTLTWSKAQQLPSLHGDAIEAAIRFHAGDDASNYANEKQTWLQTVGYEKGSHRVHVEVAASSAEEADQIKAEFAVGLRDKLPAKSITVEELRFGIAKVVHESVPGDSEFVSMGGPPSLCETTLTLSSHDRSESLSLRCKTFSSSTLFPHLPEDVRLIRLVSRFLSVTIRTSSIREVPRDHFGLTLRWKFKGAIRGETVPLADLGTAARAALLMHGSHSSPIRLSVATDGVIGLARDDFAAESPLDARALQFWTAVDRACRISAHFRLAADTTVDVGDVLDQIRNIGLVAVCLDPPVSTAKFKALATIPRPPVTDVAAVVTIHALRLGDVVVGFALALVGSPIWTTLNSKGKFRLEVPQARIKVLRQFNVPASAWNGSCRDELLNKGRLAMQDEGVSLVLIPEEG